jgi:hypothetical protein
MAIKRVCSPILWVFHRGIKIKKKEDKDYKLTRQIQKPLEIQAQIVHSYDVEVHIGG